MEKQRFIMQNMTREDGTTISKTTIADRNNFFRDICTAHYYDNAMTVAGVERIVEIDETLFSRFRINPSSECRRF